LKKPEDRIQIRQESEEVKIPEYKIVPPKCENIISEETKLSNKIFVEAKKTNKIRAVRTSLHSLVASEIETKNIIVCQYQSSNNIIEKPLEDRFDIKKSTPKDSICL
jgi:hypothetical protein